MAENHEMPRVRKSKQKRQTGSQRSVTIHSMGVTILGTETTTVGSCYCWRLP